MPPDGTVPEGGLRDPGFHNFNVGFRDRDAYEVVAFTATQIPNIEGRRYPASLAGRLYPEGIPIRAEGELAALIRELRVDLVVFAYSDVSYRYVGHRSALVHAAGADFLLMGPGRTMLQAEVPVVAVTAVRTGAGKSQTSRRLASLLVERDLKVVIVRHPMPYGQLDRQAVERFATVEDLDRYETTIEEREEYEPHIERGIVVYAGVDYGAILAQAQPEADVLLWDGGNNDLPFYRPDLHIVVADPHRPGDEVDFYPGEANLRLADVVIVNKVSTAKRKDVERVIANVHRVNPDAQMIEAASPISVEDPDVVQGKRVLAVEDGPTVTHGNMPFGAAWLAAQKFGASEIVDPRPHAVGTIREAFQNYPHLKDVLPALGYGTGQIQDLEETIEAVDADLILSGTPVDLRRVLKVTKPLVRVRYELKEVAGPTLDEVLDRFLSG